MDGQRSVMNASRNGRRGRLAAALIVGLLLAIPIGALLSLAGLLVFFLGLFFFLLFGLMLGAAMFRVLVTARPLPARSLAAIGVTTGLFAFGVSLWVESARLPAHVAKKAYLAPSFPGEHVTEGKAEAARLDLERRRRAVEARASAELTERYPPGGLIGYVRWAATNGHLEFESPDPGGATIDYRLAQGPIGFCIRLTICALLICSGVVALIWPLRRAEVSSADSATSEEGVTTPSASRPT
jgi:hypothetical protein